MTDVNPISNNSISRLISVCTRRDLDVWRVASQYIARNIEAEDYSVIVPDADVQLVAQSTPKCFRVIAESYYSSRFVTALNSAYPEAHRQRYGWYLQQFLKLSALRDGREGVSLIWDADTVPLRKLRFLWGGTVGYYTSTEYHRPYFRQIHSVTGLTKSVNVSFIAQCFAIRAEWFSEFVELIQQRNGKPWLDALIGSIDYTERSGFSEYELLGTFLFHTHKSKMTRIEGEWQRLGNTLIGGIGNLEHPRARELLSRYDYVSFEKWDRQRSAGA